MNMKLRSVLLLAGCMVVLAACGPKYSYESVKNDPLKTRIYTLPNGLKVYMNVNRETPRIQTYVAVRVGSKNDPHETTGLAHYFEHLMFKGTEQFGTQDYAAEKPMLDEIEQLFERYRKTTDEAERKAIYHRIDSISYEASKIAIPNEYDKLMSAIGAEGTNAYTGYDQTVYVEDIPSNQVENWVKIQADRFQHPVTRGFHTELETIYEEKNMSLTNDSRKVTEAMLVALFPNHPYGTQTVLGTQENLKNPSITNVRNYHKTWYVPNNMAICMSGDFDPDETIRLIDKYFGSMEPNDSLPKLQFGEQPAIDAPIVTEVYGPDAENVTVAWRLGGAASEDADILPLVNGVLYNGQAGLFDLDLLQEQKVLSAFAGASTLADYGVMMLQGRPKQGQTLDEVKELMLAEVDKLRRGDFDEGLIAATIANYKAQVMNYLDSNEGRADFYVNTFIDGIEWKDQVEALDRLSKFTKEDVVKFAQERFGDNNYALIYKREGEDPSVQKMAKPDITPIFMNRDTTSAFLRAIRDTPVKPIEPRFVDFKRDMGQLRAKNGIPVLYKKNETTDLFTLIYLYEVGNNNDPAINLASSYLQYLGTDSLNAGELARAFYDIACSFGITAGSDRTYVTISGLAENMPKAMELTEQLMNRAVPDEAILAALKADILKGRADAKLNQGSNFQRLVSYAIYGPDCLKATTLSNEQLAAISSEELLGKIRDFRNREHRILYYGPESESRLLTELGTYHNCSSELQPVPEKVVWPMLETPANKVVIAPYDANQIYMQMVSNRGEKFDPEVDAVRTLYNAYFGGGMNAIVFQEMREARALAYSASAGLVSPSRVDKPYFYQTFIATQNDKMPQAIAAFDEIINNMPESPAAFELAKESVLTGIRTQRFTKDGVLWYFISMEDLGIDYDRSKRIFEEVPSLTLDDVKAFQEKWVKGRTYTYCILGDKETLDLDYLRSLGPVEEVERDEIFGY